MVARCPGTSRVAKFGRIPRRRHAHVRVQGGSTGNTRHYPPPATQDEALPAVVALDGEGSHSASHAGHSVIALLFPWNIAGCGSEAGPEASAPGRGCCRQRASPAMPATFPVRFPGMVGGIFRRGSRNDRGIPLECARAPPGAAAARHACVDRTRPPPSREHPRADRRRRRSTVACPTPPRAPPRARPPAPRAAPARARPRPGSRPSTPCPAARPAGQRRPAGSARAATATPPGRPS